MWFWSNLVKITDFFREEKSTQRLMYHGAR